ncbi:unnamed protein product [Caenorhabditis bovis]|uniref:Actin-related protein 10 n=1 Tax=Caenorhabditis bovis TaxID=2654633 RepID=A0A8S1F1N5_9PELO|nr:unnamed protein product [Caenorhabditis bovis]
MSSTSAALQSKLDSILAARRSSSGVSPSSILSVSSTALSEAISSIDNGKNAVVIEIGAKLTKLGCAGEITPRHIIRTECRDLDGSLITSSDIMAMNNQKTMKKSVEYYTNQLLKFFRHIFFNVLAIMPSQRPVIFVESVFMSTELRNAITKIVFETLRCRSVMFIPSHVACTFAFNTQNALVVDIGHSECIAMPVVEGVTMLNEFESARSMCGEQLEKRVRYLLQKYAKIEAKDGNRRPIEIEDWQEIEEMKLVETIEIHSVCCTMEKAKQWKEWEEAEADKKPEIETITKEKCVLARGKNIVIPPVVFETSMELMFDETLRGESFDRNLPEILLKIVQKCPIDIRKNLLRNILLIGGVSIVPGFKARLKEELEVTAAKMSMSKSCEDIKFYQFKDIKNFPLFNAWIGASLFGSLRDTVERRSLTLEEYEEGKLPADWTDIIVNISS